MSDSHLQSSVLKPLEMAKLCVSRAVSSEDVLVDATLGNGHDALFLAGLVPEGEVIGFDVQQQAVENSTTRLREAGLHNFTFHHLGHEHLSDYVPSGIGACMFNLGYLPSADKSIISQTETTLAALEQAMQRLRPSGIISIMCYPGHSGGDEEAKAVRNYVSSLERKHWRCAQYQFANAPNNPAFLLLLEKL